MKKIISKVFLLIILFNAIIASNLYAFENEPEIVSPYYGVYDMDTMELLYGENQNEKISIASITKLMTAIIVVENVKDLNEKVIVDMDTINKYIEEDYAVAGIEDGQEMTYMDLLATMLIPSGADSAVFLGSIVFDDMDTFIQKMNEKAKELNMHNTSFANVIGIDDDNNYSSINDVSRLLNCALKNDVIKELITTDEYTTTDGKLTVESTIKNTSRRKNVEVKHILGGKTGTTGDAGICLASYAEDEGKTILCVTAGADMYSVRPYNIIDSEAIYDYIFDLYSYKNVVNKGDILTEINTKYLKEDSVKFLADKDISKYLDKVNKEDLRIIYNGEEIITPFTKVGEKIGKVDVYYKNEKLDTIDIVLDHKISFSLVKWLKANYLIVVGVVLLILLLILIINRVKKRKS